MVRVRFAPSPTGIPHIGNTRTALYNYLFAKKHGGKFILRIEDTDRARLVPESLDKILDILKFVGIAWDEGPKVGGPHAPYVQSQRLKLYQQHAQKLVTKKKAYYCFCSQQRLDKLRQEQQKKGQLPRYDRHCLTLSKSAIDTKLNTGKYVIRLKVPDTGKIVWTDLIQGKIEFDAKSLDDQVLLKSDGFPTYHLAVVVDDYLMKISHILRAAEWISSTPKHILLFQAFGWPIPQIGHFPVILGPDKAKLSKRHGAKSALDYRAEGYLPEALVTFMAYLGWSYEDNSQLLTLDQLVKYFELKHVQKANPTFDLSKLNYFNGKAIRQKTNSELVELLKPFIPLDCPKARVPKLIPLIQQRLVKLADFESLTHYFYRSPKIDKQLLIKQANHTTTATQAILDQAQELFSEVSDKDWITAKLDAVGHNLLESCGWAPKELFMTLRVALTGELATPPLFDTMQVLGKKEVLRRLNHAQNLL